MMCAFYFLQVHDIAESKGQDGPQQKAAARHVTSHNTPLSPMPPPAPALNNPSPSETESDSMRSASINVRSME